MQLIKIDLFKYHRLSFQGTSPLAPIFRWLVKYDYQLPKNLTRGKYNLLLWQWWPHPRAQPWLVSAAAAAADVRTSDSALKEAVTGKKGAQSRLRIHSV